MENNKINIAEILSIDDFPNEIWRDIPLLKGQYQASNMGRIKRKAAGKIREHILKQFKVGEYMSVGLSGGNIKMQRRVHRLVAMTFEWFKKALWHDAKEEPETDKKIIVQHKDFFDDINYEVVMHYAASSWQYNVAENNIIKWCYVDDLLPKGGRNDG